MIYLVSCSQEYDPTILEGDEIINWQDFCNSLMPKAAQRLLEKEKGTISPIGWLEIVYELVEILIEEYGYKRLCPKESLYGGFPIILNPVHNPGELLIRL